MEVTMNEGRTASRSWDTCQDLQTPWNQDEHQDMADTNEEQPLIIDLEDDTGLFTEDSEVVKQRKKVRADLSKEEMNAYKFKACDYESTHQVRLRAHISNRHFNGPACPCKICGLQCKNINSLQQHESRNHRSPKTKRRTGSRDYNTGPFPPRPTNSLECPPPPPPTQA